MDRVSRDIRSKIMRSVHTHNTGAEILVRSLVHHLGYRYSLTRNDLPGKPDLAFIGRRKVIFVHGCFWHGHLCRYGKLPKSRLSYWEPKIAANKERDHRQARLLKKAGWSVMIIWQCQLKRRMKLTKRIQDFLDG